LDKLIVISLPKAAAEIHEIGLIRYRYKNLKQYNVNWRKEWLGKIVG